MENEYSQFPVCPHCGYENRDYLDVVYDEEYELSCDSCHKIFYVHVYIDITYSTRKIEEAKS